MAYCEATVKWGDNRTVVEASGGGFDFVKELTSMSLENPGMAYMFEVDRQFRKKVNRLQTEKRHLFPDYVTAHNYVMAECRYIWTEARDYARKGGAAGAGGGDRSSGSGDRIELVEADKPRRGKKVRTPAEEEEARRITAQNELNRQEKLKRRAENEARVAAKKARPNPQPKQPARPQGGRGGGKGGGKGDEAITPGRMRAAQANSHTANTCVYFNLNNCNRGSDCRFAHVCWLCGGKHSWADRHA